MSSADLITVDPEVLGGDAVFRSTRALAKTLYEYLENSHSLDKMQAATLPRRR